jgi:hypothetical protein
MSVKSYEKCKGPRVVPTLEIKLQIITDFKVGKRAVDVRHKHGILPIKIRTTICDKNINMFAKLAVPGISN